MMQRLKLFLLSLTTLFTLALLGKLQFALNHFELHSEMDWPGLLGTLLWGFRFDLAIASALTLFAFIAAQLLSLLPRLRFAPLLRWTTAAAAALLLWLHGADLLYYAEAGRHMGYELKEGLNSGGALAASIFTRYALPVALQLLFIAIAILAIGRLFRRIAGEEPGNAPLKLRIATEALSLPILLLAVLGVRGGLQSVPLEPLHAQRIGHPQHATLALNGVYNALFSSITPYSVNPLFAEPPANEALALTRSLLSPTPVAIKGEALQHNVVVILLESGAGAYMAPYGHERITTPHFDQLRTEGLATRAMLAGGSRTTEGMFATFCSAQNPLGQTVAQSQLQNYNYDCLPKLLREAGWHTSFFQSSNKETSGTGSFAQLLGFRESFGKSDMAAAPHQYGQNSWGYHDPDLYRFALDKMRALPQPFLVGINTNSTHDNQIPDGVEPLLPMDNRANSYQSMLHFSDAALGEFIKAVRNDITFANTIFVLVADHSGLTPPTALQKHLIPFAILAPGLEARQLDSIATQRDVAPTLLQLLNIETPRHFTGRSLLSDNHSPTFSDYYHQGVLGWIEGNKAIEFPITKPGQLNCFSLEKRLDSKQQTRCGEKATEMQRRALAFTHTSQSLLFSGELSRFANLR
jgi:phosphoglycerol transferase MdoB-like AlkP superfamily enzyme